MVDAIKAVGGDVTSENPISVASVHNNLSICTVFSLLSDTPHHILRSTGIHTSVAMAQQGESAGYYNNAPQQPQQSYYQGQQYGQQQPMDYSQQPPQYGNNYPPPQGPPHPQQPPPQQNGYAQMQYGEKPSFDQAFKIDKPKYNDWWAGLLLIAVFLGYVAVSAISIRGYG
jgi:hypothetical protein